MRVVQRTIEEKLTKRRRLYLVFLLLLTLSDLTSAYLWLGLYKEHNFPRTCNNTMDCLYVRKSYNITKVQLGLCLRKGSTMPSVQEAARLAVRTCQGIFRFKRWNCSSLTLLPKEVLPELQDATKERAFVDAISAAALTYTAARACSSHSIADCTCGQYPDHPPDGPFKWGGCGDNVHWGGKFARRFITGHNGASKPADKKGKGKGRRRHGRRRRRRDTMEENEEDLSNVDFFTRIQIHNNNVGRRMVSESLETHCKCHGVSGACDVKTCWKGLPLNLYEIGDRLMYAYKTAVQMPIQLLPEQLEGRANALPLSLMYTHTVDYCENVNHFYTRGRMCNITADYADDCDYMCCDHGYNSREIQLASRCNCRFHSNFMNVSCERCTEWRTAKICD